MNYLILRKKGEQSTLSLVAEGTMLDRPFDSWPLDTGDKILWVNNNMHKVLRSHYMLGAYVDKAIYGYTYDEMKAILHSKLGPTEEEAYEHATRSKVYDGQGRLGVWIFGVVKFFEFLIFALFKGFKFLLIMVLIPIIIRLFSKRK